jgi:hypothetical protein
LLLTLSVVAESETEKRTILMLFKAGKKSEREREKKQKKPQREFSVEFAKLLT